MQILMPGGTGIIENDDIKALVGQTADGGGNALVGKNAGTDNVGNAHVGEHQPQVRTRQRAVGGFRHDDFTRRRLKCGDNLRGILILR